MLSEPYDSGDSTMTRTIELDAESQAKPVVIPPEALKAETLRAVLEAHANRDGTDYGLVEASLAAKVRMLELQLQRGEAVLTFDPGTESVNLVRREALPR
jgi:uncharacterized protein